MPITRKSGPLAIGGRHALAVEGDAVGAAVVHVELQVQEARLAGVEDAQAIAPRLDRRLRVDGAVGQHRVAEHLGDDRRVGQVSLTVGSELPAIRLVDVRVPQAARGRRARARSGSMVVDGLASDEDLVLDDDGDLAAAVLDEVGQAQVAQVALEAVADDVGRWRCRRRRSGG